MVAEGLQEGAKADQGLIIIGVALDVGFEVTAGGLESTSPLKLRARLLEVVWIVRLELEQP